MVSLCLILYKNNKHHNSCFDKHNQQHNQQHTININMFAGIARLCSFNPFWTGILMQKLVYNNLFINGTLLPVARKRFFTNL